MSAGSPGDPYQGQFINWQTQPWPPTTTGVLTTYTTTTNTTTAWPPQQILGLGGSLMGAGLNPAPQPPQYLYPPGDPACPHDAWEMQPTNRLGYGTCLNCGGAYSLDVLVNALRDRLLDAVARLEQRLASTERKIA